MVLEWHSYSLTGVKHCPKCWWEALHCLSLFSICVYSFLFRKIRLGLKMWHLASLFPSFFHLLFALSEEDFKWKTVSGFVCFFSKRSTLITTSYIDSAQWEHIWQYGFCTQYLFFEYFPMLCWYCARHTLFAYSECVFLKPSLPS